MNFKKIALVLLAVLFIAGAAFAGRQDFILDNQTCHRVLTVRISPTGDGMWGPDRLSGILYPGHDTIFTFSGHAERYWDIKIVYTDSKPDAVFTGVDLFTNGRLIIRDNNRGGTTLSLY